MGKEKNVLHPICATKPTIWIMTVTTVLGFLLAIPLGLTHAVGPWYLSAPSRIFCTVIPGTPLFLQIWLLYYGLGSLFP